MPNKLSRLAGILLLLASVLCVSACANVVPPPASSLTQGQWPQYEYPQPEGGG